MSTEVSTVRAGTAVAVAQPRPHLSYEEAMELANGMVRAQWLPESYRRTRGGVIPEEEQANKAAIAILMGQELGLQPMQSTRAIAVIGNMPSIWGDSALGICMASPAFKDMKEELETKEIDQQVENQDRSTRTIKMMVPFKATCTIWRKDREHPIVGTFTYEQARKAGLWGKQGPWSQYPDRMMKLRARLFALRDAFADVLAGMPVYEDAPTEALASEALPSDAPAMPQESDYTETEVIDEGHPENPELDAAMESVKDPEPKKEKAKPEPKKEKAKPEKDPEPEPEPEPEQESGSEESEGEPVKPQDDGNLFDEPEQSAEESFQYIGYDEFGDMVVGTDDRKDYAEEMLKRIKVIKAGKDRKQLEGFWDNNFDVMKAAYTGAPNDVLSIFREINQVYKS